MLKKSNIFCQDECQDLIASIIQNLVAMESHLKDSQDAELKVDQSEISLFGSFVVAKFPT